MGRINPMPQSADETWTPIIEDFLFHMRTNMSTIKGYSDLLAFDLEVLKKQDNSPLTRDSFTFSRINMTPEQALEVIGYVQNAVQNLWHLHNELNEKIYKHEDESQEGHDDTDR
jgi:hypothetical protein